VSHTVLYSLVIYAVGCIVPTPLDQQPQPIEYTPSFITELIDPPFGAVSHAKTDQWSWRVHATDPSVDDTLQLYVRLMFLTADKTFDVAGTAGDINMTKEPLADPRGPSVWNGESHNAAWCGSLIPGTYYLYAFVADKNFIMSSEKTGGVESWNYWVLTCM
jgi:hypothetical protein